MPTVPKLRQQTRLRPGSPVTAESVGAAGARGQALQSFGQGLFKAGTVLADQQAREQRSKRLLDTETADGLLTDAALRFQDDALRNGKTDGSNFVDLFDAQFSKEAEGIVKGIEDQETRQAVSSAALDTRNRIAQGLFKKGRTQFAKHGFATLQTQMNTRTSAVFQNPDLHAAESTKFINMVNQQTDLLSPSDQEKVRNLATQSFARAKVQGFVDQDRYTEARGAVKELGAIFGAKDSKTLSDMIDAEQFQAQNRATRVAHNNRIELEAKTKEDREANDLKALALLRTSETEVGRDELDKFVKSKITTNSMNLKTVRFVRGDLKEIRRKINDRAAFTFTERSLSEGYSEQLHKDIIRAVNEEILFPEEGEALLKSLQTTKSKTVSSGFRSNLKNANRLMDAHFKKDTFTFTMGNEDRQRKAQAYITRQELIANGEDPVKASYMVIQQFLGDSRSAPFVPGIDLSKQTSLEQFREVGKELKRQFANGAISKGQYLGRLLIYQERLKAFQREAAIKVGPFELETQR